MKAIQNMITEGFVRGIDMVLPPRCIVTGEMVDRQGMLSPEGWTGLDFIAPPQCLKCGVPFDYVLEEGAVCTDCLEKPPKYATARAALKYNDSSRDLILGFKHGDKTHAVLAFVPWLLRAGTEMLEGVDWIVPVPLHSKRLLMRRYNQAALMAWAVSKETRIPCLPMGLRRTRATKTQGHLNIAERKKNVRKAFDVPPQFLEKFQDKKIVLVDDVYTTGATVNECTKALLRTGVREVHVLTLARVVRAEYYKQQG